jgi:hypothetical protein
MSKAASRRHQRSAQRKSSQQTSSQPKTPYQPKSARVPAPPPKKVHGGWLTAMLIIIGLHGVLTTALLLTLRKQPGPMPPTWLIAAAVAVGLADILAAVAIWFWKRWGLYLYVVSSLAGIALGLVVFPTPLLITAFHGIIPVAILGYILTWQKKMPLLA